MPPHYLSEQEIAALRLAIGKPVFVDTDCTAEGDDGVAARCRTNFTGNLVDVLSHEPQARRADYLLLTDNTSSTLYHLNFVDGRKVWDLHKTVSTTGFYMQVVSDKDREELPALDTSMLNGKKTYLEPEFLARNELVQLLAPRS